MPIAKKSSAKSAAKSPVAVDPIDELDVPVIAPLVFAGGHDPIDEIPTSVEVIPFSLAQYAPTNDEGGESFPLTARCPVEWLAIIEEIRQDPNLPFKSLYKTRSDFVRMCIKNGIDRVQQFKQQLALASNQDVDPIIDAHLFVENTLGTLNARTMLITGAEKTVRRLADSVDVVMRADEPGEAARQISVYVEGVAKQTDPFWRSFFMRVLFDHTMLATRIKQLIEMGALTDAYVIEYAEAVGLVNLHHDDYESSATLAPGWDE